MSYNMPFDRAGFLVKAATQIIKPRVEIAVEKELSKLKAQLITAFETHPVTQEIQAGPDSGDSRFMPNGYGNLFSYIGFSSMDDPLDIIRGMLYNIDFHVGRFLKISRGFNISVIFPSTENIYQVTPLPWAMGRSWVWALESGSLSNFGQYMYSETRTFRGSRSGPAIQIDRKLRPNATIQTPYVTPLINQFEERARNIQLDFSQFTRFNVRS